MKFSRFKKWILIAILLFLGIAQFFPIDKTNPTVDPKLDMFSILDAEPGIKTLIRDACYDCHSNESEYPWYTNIAPISWWIQNHITVGREELNFSTWGTYSDRRKEHKLDECMELVENGSMPLGSYKLLHPEARLSKEQRQQLITWFQSKL